MSDNDKDKGKEPEGKKGGGGAAALVAGVILPALFAGGAAFGGAKIAVARMAHASATEHAEPAHVDPPGPTLTLEPFVLVKSDGQHNHPMRVAIAVEFNAATPQESLATFVPRIRDAALAYLREMTLEDATNGERVEHMRTEMLAKFREAGAGTAQRVLVTDMVVQ